MQHPSKDHILCKGYKKDFSERQLTTQGEAFLCKRHVKNCYKLGNLRNYSLEKMKKKAEQEKKFKENLKQMNFDGNSASSSEVTFSAEWVDFDFENDVVTESKQGLSFD